MTEWLIGDLGDHAEIVLGGTPSTDVPAFWDGDIPWMTSGDLHQRLVEDVPGRITEEGIRVSNAVVVDPPAVAVGLAGQGKTRGTVALTLLPVSTNQSVALIRGHHGVLDTHYLFQNLVSRYEELRASSAGGGRAGLSKRILERLPICIPPFKEQRRIAKILDTIDDAIQATDRVIAKLRPLGQALFADALASTCAEEAPIGSLAQVTVGHVGPIAGAYTDSREGVPLFSTASIHPGTLTATPSERVSAAFHKTHHGSEVRTGDVIVARHGESGTAALIPSQSAGGQALNVCIVRRSAMLDGEFLVSLLGHEPILRDLVGWQAGSVQGVVNTKRLRQLRIPAPPFAEQRLIVEPLRMWRSRLAAERSVLDGLRTLRIGLADDLLSGRARTVAA